MKNSSVYISKRPADYPAGLSNLPYSPIPPDHGNGNFLLAGRCAFPKLFQLLYLADPIIFQRIPKQIIRGDFQYIADIDKYRQTRNLCPAFNLPEIGCVDIVQLRERVRRKSLVFLHHVDTFA